MRRDRLLCNQLLALSLVVAVIVVIAGNLQDSGMDSTDLTDHAEAGPATFSDGGPLPKLLVFDLDYTLWPFWVDTHVSSPIKAKDNGSRVTDRTKESFSFYTDVPNILRSAKAVGLPMSLASRTSSPDLATQMLKLLLIRQPGGTQPVKAFDFFSNHQIYPGDKRTHMRRLNTNFDVEFKDILFFDDETRNRNVESLGVCFWLVRDGVSKAEIDNGVREWRKRRDD